MYTLAFLYSPKASQVHFLEQVLDMLQNFAEGILGGNLTLDLRTDMTGSSSHLLFASLRRLKKCLFAHQLIDAWRAFSPTGRDYTHYLPPHDTYSRFDFFLTKQHDLARVTKTNIGSIHLWDHAPISLGMQLGAPHRAPFQ